MMTRESFQHSIFVANSSSPRSSSEGCSPGEEYLEEEKILPASRWGSSLGSEEKIVKRRHRRMRLPQRFRLLSTPSRKEEERSEVLLTPISKSSFYSGSTSISPKLKRRANENYNVPKGKRRKMESSISRRRPHTDGMNKGVSHGIKRPKKTSKAKKIMEEERSRKRIKKKQQEEEQEDRKKAEPPCYMPSSRGGSLSMSSEKPKVFYEIIGGQMVFRRHREPPLQRSNPPKTRLFSPSRNFLHAPSPSSPVKFSVLEEEKECPPSVCLSDLIENINSQCDGAKTKNSEEEIQKIAIETEEQIRSLLVTQEEESLMLDVVPEARVVFSDAHDRGDMRKNISTIISNIPILIEDGEVASTPHSEGGGGYFPIFSKDTALSGLDAESSTSNAPTKKFIKDGALTQMVIDAGQKSMGAQFCLTCSTVYTVGDPQDEEAHAAIHGGLLDTISFKGWQKERVVRYLPEVGRRIIMVDLGDETRHWERSKVLSVLSLVDKAIGSQTDLSKMVSPCAFLYIADKMVVGVLLAEKTGGMAHPSTPDGHTIDTRKALPILAGVSRLWVMPEYQRQGLASKLTDAFRENYFGSMGAHFIKMNEFAFSQTTPNGSAFASKYTGKEDFLVYLPSDDSITA